MYYDVVLVLVIIAYAISLLMILELIGSLMKWISDIEKKIDEVAKRCEEQYFSARQPRFS